MSESAKEGQLLWQPSEAQRQASKMADYLAYLQRTRSVTFRDYAELYDWSVSELGERAPRRTWTRAELADDVARARAGLRRLGVTRGDRVAAVLPNGGEALIAFLATASLGAVWSSCAPEFGVSSVLDRFRQIEPKVLFGVTGYDYGGKHFERSAEMRQIVDGLPSLVATVLVGEASASLPGAHDFASLLSEYEPLTFEAVPFEHPIW